MSELPDLLKFAPVNALLGYIQERNPQRDVYAPNGYVFFQDMGTWYCGICYTDNYSFGTEPNAPEWWVWEESNSAQECLAKAISKAIHDVWG